MNLKQLASEGTHLFTMDRQGAPPWKIAPVLDAGRADIEGLRRYRCVAASGNDLMIVHLCGGDVRHPHVAARTRKYAERNLRIKQRTDSLLRYHEAGVCETWQVLQGAAAMTEVAMIAEHLNIPITIRYEKADETVKEYTITSPRLNVKALKGGRRMVYLNGPDNRSLRMDRVLTITPLQAMGHTSGGKWRAVPPRKP